MRKTEFWNRAWRVLVAIGCAIFGLFSIIKVVGRALLVGADKIDRSASIATAVRWITEAGNVGSWAWGEGILVLVATVIVVLHILQRGPFKLSKHNLKQKEHEDEITKAVCGRLNKSELFSFVRNPIGSSGYFLEYALHDPTDTYLAETLLIREVADPVLTAAFRRQTRSVSKLIAEKDRIYHHVTIVLLLYGAWTIPDRVSLAQQFEGFRRSYGISEKISFESWDKNDLDRYVSS